MSFLESFGGGALALLGAALAAALACVGSARAPASPVKPAPVS